ncbi:hypothetical protein ONZ45_g7362 [Pleurotus djamor]|nr:hypothetical protein ONZ45_g7362 [Pleurotus djamor]
MLQYQPKHALVASHAKVHSVAISPDGNYLAAASNQVQVWNLSTAELLCNTPWTAWPLCIQWRNSSQFIIGHDDGMLLSVQLSHSNHGKEGILLQGYDPWDSPITSMSLHPDSAFIALGGGKRAEVWQPFQGDFGRLEHVQTMPDPPLPRDVVDDVTSVRWVNPQVLLVAYKHHGVLIRDINRASRVIRGISGPTMSGGLSLSPDGRYLASNGDEECVIVSVETGGRLMTVEVEGVPQFDGEVREGGNPFRPVAFVHNGNMILVARGSKAELWDIGSNTRSKNMGVDVGDITCIADHYLEEKDIFSIAVATDAGTIKVWQTEHRVNKHVLRDIEPEETGHRTLSHKKGVLALTLLGAGVGAYYLGGHV